MRILLTNDDGYGAPGLNCLASVLGVEHEIYVVAPDRERSGVSHAFTLGKPLRCDPVEDEFEDGRVAGAWKCSGTPVDCVKIAVLTILRDCLPDVIISGINRGANISIDHLYSGTVAGALEGCIQGFPTLAVSLKLRETVHLHFETAAEFIRRFLADEKSRALLSKDYVLNVNAPSVPYDEIKGSKITCIGQSVWHDKYREHEDPHGRPYYWLEGDFDVPDKRDWADIVAVNDGYVSITPLIPDLTSHELVEKLRSTYEGC